MTNKEIAAILSDIAIALELVDDNPFRAKAYARGARSVEAMPVPVTELVRANSLRSIEGLGQSVAETVTEIAKVGSSSLLESLISEIPPDVWSMLKIRGLGPKRVRAIWRNLHIETMEELEEACLTGLIRDLPGFGQKTQESISQGILQLRRYAGRLLLPEAQAIAETYCRYIVEVLSDSFSTESASPPEAVGELRRSCETVGGIELLVTASDEDTIADIKSSLETAGLATTGEDEKLTLKADETPGGPAHLGEVELRIHVGLEIDRGRQLFLLTGAPEHVEECEAFCSARGVKFAGDEPCRDEDEFYGRMGLPWIPPEMREGLGEASEASEIGVPQLLTDEDIRGILHVHSNYSDGTDSIESIVKSCIEHRMEYVGISDHSQSAFYAHGLTEDDIRRQHDEILEVQQRYPGIVIFHGIESDILQNGSLDYSDDVLNSLDFVIGSVHSRFGMAPKEMTRRVIRALEHPHLSILGHPTGRILLSRESYGIDMDLVLEAAARTGKAVELNASPYRLDLDWRKCIVARRLGIPISINPDAHAVEQLVDVRYGVAVARKAGLTRSDVINCLPGPAIRQRLRAGSKGHC